MASLLFKLAGWANSPTENNTVHSYNNETGLWSTSHAVPPFAGTVASNNNDSPCFKGGWDGNSWYVLSPTGGLYSYNPVQDAWAGPLGVSGSIITGFAEDLVHCMCSDGRFVYLMSSGGDFRRYDPGSNTITTLSAPPGASYARTLFLVYNASGGIYGSKGGGTPAVIGRYDIATDSWTTIASGDWSSELGAAFGSWPAYLQGKLWLIYNTAASLMRAFEYDPTTDTWTAKSTTTGTSFPPAAYGGEDSDSSIRLWSTNSGVASKIYDIVADTWSTGINPTHSGTQGANFAVTRVFNAEFTWLEEDEATAAPGLISLGSAVVGEVLEYHSTIRTPVARAQGITVSVPVNNATDAEDAVTICNTADGVFGSSFTTGALDAGDIVDVFIKVTPTAAQTLGLSKTFNLKSVAN